MHWPPVLTLFIGQAVGRWRAIVARVQAVPAAAVALPAGAVVLAVTIVTVATAEIGRSSNSRRSDST